MEWIPIERVLPEDNRAVLVYEKNYNNIYTAYYDSAYGWMTCNPCVYECFGEHLDVVAWMPLPKPYTADTPQTDCDNKDEPKTNGYQTFNGTSVYVSRLTDEPQTERSSE